MSNSTGSELAIGYASLFVSCAAFGFMFAPLKRLDSKDGVFVQWIQCSVVFMFGLIINVIRGLPQFNLIASIGGFLYATGNVASVPIVAEMGIGLGMLIWGSVQIIVGWCVAHFGLFGTKPQNVQNPLLNYLGVLITLFSGIMFVFVYSRNERDKKLSQIEKDYDNNRIAYRNERAPSTYGTVHNVWAVESEQDNGNNAATTLENLPRIEQSEIKRTVTPRLTKRKLFFIGLSVCLGSLHG
uniref:Transmembrane protein 144 n=1 Tax=Meloidogyne incognita TaxID=6306 RepID=A0A914N4E6_MELIC